MPPSTQVWPPSLDRQGVVRLLQWATSCSGFVGFLTIAHSLSLPERLLMLTSAVPATTPSAMPLVSPSSGSVCAAEGPRSDRVGSAPDAATGVLCFGLGGGQLVDLPVLDRPIAGAGPQPGETRRREIDPEVVLLPLGVEVEDARDHLAVGLAVLEAHRAVLAEEGFADERLGFGGEWLAVGRGFGAVNADVVAALAVVEDDDVGVLDRREDAVQALGGGGLGRQDERGEGNDGSRCGLAQSELVHETETSGAVGPIPRCFDLRVVYRRFLRSAPRWRTARLWQRWRTFSPGRFGSRCFWAPVS